MFFNLINTFVQWRYLLNTSVYVLGPGFWYSQKGKAVFWYCVLLWKTIELLKLIIALTGVLENCDSVAVKRYDSYDGKVV